MSGRQGKQFKASFYHNQTTTNIHRRSTNAIQYIPTTNTRSQREACSDRLGLARARGCGGHT